MVENSKWKVQGVVKTVKAFCVIDGIAQKLAPACQASCRQPIPSSGRYSLGFFNCFFEALLGTGWNTGKAAEAGTPSTDAMATALGSTFAACPAL
jgi:hypothetical protein